MCINGVIMCGGKSASDVLKDSERKEEGGYFSLCGQRRTFQEDGIQVKVCRVRQRPLYMELGRIFLAGRTDSMCKGTEVGSM